MRVQPTTLQKLKQQLQTSPSHASKCQPTALRCCCGRCYEIACSDMWLSDNYGNSLNRQSVYCDLNSSVVVSITDTCPCYYTPNSYSNKRW